LILALRASSRALPAVSAAVLDSPWPQIDPASLWQREYTFADGCHTNKFKTLEINGALDY
jgi:hypothetical protein